MSDKKRAAVASVIGAVSGIAVTLLFLLLFAFVITKSRHIQYTLIAPMAIAAACIGAFVGGYITARINKSFGMLVGTICGALILMILLAVGAASGELPGMLSLLRGALMLISGAIGGILGVNRRRKRKKN